VFERFRSYRPTLVHAVALLGVASFLLIGTIGYGALHVVEGRLVAHDMEETRRSVRSIAARLVQPAVTPGVVAGNAFALTEFDRRVRERVLRPGILQVILWSDDGTILYSDAAELIGRRSALEPEQRSLLEAGRGSGAEFIDAGGEEPALLPAGGEVTDAFAAIVGPDGEKLLFEAYVEPNSLIEPAESMLRSLGLIGGAAVAVLVAGQTALALALAHLMVRSREARIDVLRRAARATDGERRRIAADLHDGVIQDLQGLAFDLDTAGPLPTSVADASSSGVSDFAARLRHSLNDLRKVATDLHPPKTHRGSLRDALERLLRTYDGRLDATFDLDVDTEPELGAETRELLFRAAQEAVRNVVAHANASSVVLKVWVCGGYASLTVTDDGRGIAVGSSEVEDGHLGLALIAEAAEAAGGRLVVRSCDFGTCVLVEVPA
jgi:two-component system, NarL family, sensor kinase